MLENLLTYPCLIVTQEGEPKVYPIVYEFDGKHLKWALSNNRIAFLNINSQKDIDWLYLSAYLTLHKGKEL